MYASEATQATVGNSSTSLFKMAPSLFCAADKKGKEPYVDVDRYTTSADAVCEDHKDLVGIIDALAED